MLKCPECGRTFEKVANRQIYCGYEKNGQGRSYCARRAVDRRGYRNINPAVLRRKLERSKRWRKQMKLEGKCGRCGKAPAEPGLSHCAECGGRDR